jgi:hypothetical protein
MEFGFRNAVSVPEGPTPQTEGGLTAGYSGYWLIAFGEEKPV